MPSVSRVGLKEKCFNLMNKKVTELTEHKYGKKSDTLCVMRLAILDDVCLCLICPHMIGNGLRRGMVETFVNIYIYYSTVFLFIVVQFGSS